MKLFRFLSISLILLCLCLSSSAQTKFKNVAREAGVNAFSQSVAPVWDDYDNDGDLDLYVTGGDWVNMVMAHHVFYRNNGDGTFTDFTGEAGLQESKGDGRYACFLDYDNDGYIDLYVPSMTWEGNFANFKSNILLYHNKGDGKFDEVSEDAGLKASDFATYSGGFLDYDNDGFLDLYIMQNWGPNILYRNKGNGEFIDVANEAGVMGSNDGGFNFTAGDYDNDGDTDIYIPGGGGGVDGPSVLFRNNGDGSFSDVTKKAGVSSTRRGRGSAFFDYDNDGDMDLFTVSGTQASLLYQNNGDGTFTGVAFNKAGIIGSSFERLAVGDYDNDGFMDMYLMPYNRTRVLYRNNGDGTFTDVAKEAGVGGFSIRSGGCTFGDYDNDGDLDIYASNIGGFNELFRNEGNDNHWLHIVCTGSIGDIPINVKRTNRDGVGARVIVQAGDLSMIREINPGCSRGHNPLIAYFGLGQNTIADSVEIHWPSGQVTNLTNLPADQMIEVKEGDEGYKILHKGSNNKTKAVDPRGKVASAWGRLKGDELYQNYPNPFNPETWIPYQLGSDSEVTIRVYDLSGRLVRTLDLGHKPADFYSAKDKAAHWDGANEASEEMASGIYFYTIEAGDFTATKKMIIAR